MYDKRLLAESGPVDISLTIPTHNITCCNLKIGPRHKTNRLRYSCEYYCVKTKLN